jgi:hypothetical protein
VNSDAADPSTEHTSLRHLRPKLQSEIVPAQSTLPAQLDDMNDHPIPPMSNPPASTAVSSTSSSFCNSGCMSARPKADDPSLSSSANLEIQQPQYCDTFHTFFQAVSRPSSENSILCSQARDLIDQYNIGGQDIQHISLRLAAGLGPELNAGEGCRVDKQLLFEVLNDISSNLS